MHLLINLGNGSHHRSPHIRHVGDSIVVVWLICVVLFRCGCLVWCRGGRLIVVMQSCWLLALVVLQQVLVLKPWWWGEGLVQSVLAIGGPACRCGLLLQVGTGTRVTPRAAAGVIYN